MFLMLSQIMLVKPVLSQFLSSVSICAKVNILEEMKENRTCPCSNFKANILYEVMMGVSTRPVG